MLHGKKKSLHNLSDKIKIPIMENKKSLIASTLDHILPKLNVVSREEFDIQCRVLQKTLLKLEELEKKLTLLENQRV
jgi:BMFP domain-containing protein YqiC